MMKEKYNRRNIEEKMAVLGEEKVEEEEVGKG
jgi:hypothetical protein